MSCSGCGAGFKPDKVKITIDGKELKYFQCGIKTTEKTMTFIIITKEDSDQGRLYS